MRGYITKEAIKLKTETIFILALIEKGVFKNVSPT